MYTPAGETDHRAPCPALNALANHGYIPHSGIDVTFLTLIHALTTVYNISLPLALLLSVPTFLIYGKFQYGSLYPWKWRYTLDLASLSAFGHNKIAHYASFVHPNHPSHKPDPGLLRDLLERSHHQSGIDGMTLSDLAALRVARELSLPPPIQLDSLHKQIALGESALTWLVLRNQGHDACERDDIVPSSRLAQWFGEERLPDGWWEGVRPSRTVGLLDTKKRADQVQREMGTIRSGWQKV